MSTMPCCKHLESPNGTERFRTFHVFSPLKRIVDIFIIGPKAYNFALHKQISESRRIQRPPGPNQTTSVKILTSMLECRDAIANVANDLLGEFRLNYFFPIGRCARQNFAGWIDDD